MVMKSTYRAKLVGALVAVAAGVFVALSAEAQQAEKLDEQAARAGLSVKPPRNPVKSSAPIVRRTYERRPVKGLGVETGPSDAETPKEVDVEVVHRSDGTTEVRPYVPLPILFAVASDRLLDATSRKNVDEMAEILQDFISREGAVFSVQGHTSAEGTAESNQHLSEARAARIHQMLAAKGVEATAIEPIGLGEDCARFPENAQEAQLQQDRRVLIVRMR